MKIKFDSLNEFNCFLRKCKDIYINNIKVKNYKAKYMLGMEHEEQEIELEFEFAEE
ncbi:hypothetical protein [Helcococcus ovis]|uniref:hypothetical protein n=1 Tax=Helcococcus ovis TaxID=72026 RepID=UPI001431C887|nr:hypothetical protein [Helcococcus ovis]WNZ00899.1 hypothetical protein EQF90_006435 [Helcococcus ovis]